MPTIQAYACKLCVRTCLFKSTLHCAEAFPALDACQREGLDTAVTVANSARAKVWLTRGSKTCLTTTKASLACKHASASVSNAIQTFAPKQYRHLYLHRVTSTHSVKLTDQMHAVLSHCGLILNRYKTHQTVACLTRLVVELQAPESGPLALLLMLIARPCPGGGCIAAEKDRHNCHCCRWLAASTEAGCAALATASQCLLLGL